ncbi:MULTISPECIES: MobH family relaxase [unclassified Pseudomonas]|uniref:MobH family relaxase n=1 Tax=unclassified Pseudomonas TaxID=196821 RepID=UPI000D9A426D|nr:MULTISPECIES: MobH family relaxase [unclassified Pseudomonas]PYG78438.1 integrating conjugative element relaxase (TIGR03760 family) [Pseudomonas sp. RV120224-01c]PYG82620.1 integrating conjugative element relaxase (TIGR03760 family) [Pseudomonas sp. RV120224-01b]
MKRWWLTRQKGEAAEPTLTPFAEGFMLPQSAESLLSADHRRKLLERIWQYTALSEAQFDRLYLEPIRRYASFVQQVPASESHHHAYPGGMLDHGLELVACSLKLRQSYLLPSGAAPEDQAAQADAWSAAIAYGALLHDIGKIAVDVQVEYQNGECWHPWHGPLNQPYRFRYKPGRDYKLHGAAAGLLYTQILSHALLDWLSGYPELWSQLLFLLADHYEHAGPLGELVLQADRVSTAQNIGGNPVKALQAPKHSLQHHLLMGLRHLVKNEFKLNQPGAAGWLTEEHLWLVSKTATDKLRAHLLAQSVDGIPTSNIALFDELQSHGLVEPTPDGRAVWSATVVNEGWEHRFTFLRLQPSLIWADEIRPPCFAGSIKFEVGLDALNSVADQPLAAPLQRPTEGLASMSSIQEVDYLDDLMAMLQATSEPENESEPAAPDAAFTHSISQPFVNWLKDGLRSHRLLINDSKAKIHVVNGTYFLVTPGLFQLYVSEQRNFSGENGIPAWRHVQRQFEKLNLHMKRPNGQNIWSCRVQGPRKTSSVNGYLINDSKALSAELPLDNTYLTLVL